MMVCDLHDNTTAGLGAPALPPDLRRWVAEQRLIRLVLEAVQAVRAAQPLAGTRPGPEACSDVTLLTVLTYGYGTGVLRSRDLETQAQADAALRYLCAYQFPSASVLRQFRRSHSALLCGSLAELFRRVWAATQAGAGLRPPAEWQTLFARAGQARLEEAIQLDSMDLDE